MSFFAKPPAVLPNCVWRSGSPRITNCYWPYLMLLGLTRLSLEPSEHLMRGLPKQGAAGMKYSFNPLDGLALESKKWQM